MTVNPHDPLLKTGPQQQHELFRRFCKEANAFAVDEVIGAAFNVIINALRQAYATRAAVEPRYDELFAKNKSLLLDHYDALGRKKGIFPYAQTVEMPHYRSPDKTIPN